MFVRARYVTNSSTSSYIVYGIELTGKELNNILMLLHQKFPEEANKYSEYEKLNKDDQDNLTPPEYFIEVVYDNLGDGLPEPLLPKVVGGILKHPETDKYWLDLNVSLQSKVVGNNVVLINAPANDVKRVVELAKEAGVKDTTLQLDHWAEYE